MRTAMAQIALSILFLFMSGTMMCFAAVWNAEQLKVNGGCQIIYRELLCSK